MASLQHFSAFLTCGGIHKICNYYTYSHFIHLTIYISIDIPYTIHTYFGQLYFIYILFSFSLFFFFRVFKGTEGIFLFFCRREYLHLDIHFLIYSVPAGGGVLMTCACTPAKCPRGGF